MVHRGGLGYEKNTGDGAGILTTIPDRLFRRIVREDIQRDLPESGKFGVGNVFLPHDEAARERCKNIVNEAIEASCQNRIGWRPLPIDPDGAEIGNAARAAMPCIEQLYVEAGGVEKLLSKPAYLMQISRKLMEITLSEPAGEELFYFCSLSSRVIIYKGMLTPHQLYRFYPDLQDEDYESHLAMVHSRFSTNTFPSWDRAQPNRFMSHNGEINTLLGNKNWMNAREGVVKSDLFGDDLAKAFPIVEPDCSDSGTFDNVLEFLLITGRTLQEAVLMISRKLAASPANVASEARFLRVSVLFDGTLGWSGVNRVHRWKLHRRSARSQRLTPVALLHYFRRQMHHGFGSRRVGRPAAKRSRKRTLATRQGIPYRFQPRPHGAR